MYVYIKYFNLYYEKTTCVKLHGSYYNNICVNYLFFIYYNLMTRNN